MPFKPNNKDAEIWTIEEAKELFNEANRLALDDEYDFIGEIASKLDTYREIFVYLKDKFPELKHDYKRLTTKLESSCFSHSKKGTIKEATAIMNLKSNYGWTDRINTELSGEVNTNKNVQLTNEQLKEVLNEFKPK
jgi:hypothetical protein